MKHSYELTKKYKNKTAGGWLKKVMVRKSMAGIKELWCDSMIAVRTSHDNLMLIDYGYVVAHLSTSDRASKKLINLTRQLEVQK